MECAFADKLTVPNVFVNIRLLEVLVINYNLTKRYTQFRNGDAFIKFSTSTMNEVFNLDPNPDKPLSFRDLEEVYLRMDTTYTGWKISIHKRQPRKLNEEYGPSFSIDLFRHYLQYTYMSCEQVGGVEVPDLASIGPLVLASNIQMYEPGPFDYATYLVEKLHEGFLNLKDNRNPTFKFDSLLMHLVLFYGGVKG